MRIVEIPSTRGMKLPIRIKRPTDRQSSSRSATRALDVLELFGELKRPLRAHEIAELLDIPPPSTHQLLKTLIDSSHLIFDSRSKSYFPSPRLTKFSSWLSQAYDVAGEIGDLSDHVHFATGMAVTISTQNDIFMQVIDRRNAIGQMIPRGVQIALFGTATGSAFLSMSADDEIVRLASRARIPLSEMPAILQTVDGIRQDGFADGYARPGHWAVAVPVCGFRIPMVLAVGGPVAQVRDNVEQLSRTMREAAARWLGGLAAGPATIVRSRRTRLT